MGQKANPISFRLIRNADWRSKWFANKQEFGNCLSKIINIRTLPDEKTGSARAHH